MTTGAAEYARHLRGVMAPDNPDGPHQVRVALRRLRVALAAFKPTLRTSVCRTLQTALHDTFRTLGTLRDADVLALMLNTPDLHTARLAPPRLRANGKPVWPLVPT